MYEVPVEQRFGFWYPIDVADALNAAEDAENPVRFLAEWFGLVSVPADRLPSDAAEQWERSSAVAEQRR